MVGSMSRLREHSIAERHISDRAPWLRAAVLGANDGLISTASLMIGVSAASTGASPVIIAGVAGITAGALSMAAGEFVSVSSQRDAEQADIERERRELEQSPELELEELVAIYRRRGLSEGLARAVALELSAPSRTSDERLAVHVRDELGFELDGLAKPVQAAAISASSFVLGAALPFATMWLFAARFAALITMVVTLVGLVVLGGLGAHLGGAPRGRASIRVAIGGSVALLISLAIGRVTGGIV